MKVFEVPDYKGEKNRGNGQSRPSISSITASVQLNMRSGYIEGYLWEKNLVGADDQLRQELVGQGVEVSSVKLGVRSGL
jgi:hypothetical protein